ncbi:unnamed protein product [Brachionus calyciflorus]|uniref:Uncharacterized protein n=1 Tax=Brachionus calyciflorus TaxID=104777 RepID=A0A813T7J6_9BILA|nr:unnamed protein product [Brachionus calyciflorus]
MSENFRYIQIIEMWNHFDTNGTPQVDASLKYFRAAKNEKPPTRNKLYMINDAILLNQKHMLKDKDTYDKYAIQAFDFSKLEAKL